MDTGILFRKTWLSRHDVEHLPLSSSEVKIEWGYTSTPLCVLTPWTGMALLLSTAHTLSYNKTN